MKALAFAARHTMPEMIETCTYLSTKYTCWTAHEDTGLLWVYGYWQGCVDAGEDALTLRIDIADAVKGTLYTDFFSDSDHATDWARKSTSGAAAIVLGDHGSRAMIAEGSKGQPSVAKSSGEAELKAVDEIVKSIETAPSTELEIELFRAAAPKTKAAVGTVTRIAYPVSLLMSWMLHGRPVQIRVRYLNVDASVAISVTLAGSSRQLAYITKSMAVDLLWIQNNLNKFALQLKKVASKQNASDLLTKAVTREVLRALLPLIGRGPRLA